MDCIFCQIANKKINATIIYEDDQVVAFDDLYPKAPIHKLIIPREHIATINDLKSSHKELIGQLLLVAQQLANDLNVAADGYRVLMNCNKGGGQEVYHIHLHLLAGRQMQWPPG